ncbi:MAG TPA: DMT family transporter [Kofleriaceae bacterium]
MNRRIGPWLVAAGAALWGTENAWRVPLVKKLDPDVIVFWEHVGLVLLALPFVIPRLGELKRVSWKAIAWLLFSGAAGSALGAVLFTTALDHGNITVNNVVLNVQPVLSTAFACLLFRDRLAKSFFPWAALAVAAGVLLVWLQPGPTFVLSSGVVYALLTALCWGLSTVAGRGVMVEMSLPLASGLRVIVGLVCMTILCGARGLFGSGAMWPAAAAAETGATIGQFVLLVTLSGGLPLVIYFEGLRRTRASTAGYFEMMQTLAAVAITWGFFHAPLSALQVGAAVVLVAAVVMVQRAQASVGE